MPSFLKLAERLLKQYRKDISEITEESLMDALNVRRPSAGPRARALSSPVQH